MAFFFHARPMKLFFCVPRVIDFFFFSDLAKRGAITSGEVSGNRFRMKRVFNGPGASLPCLRPLKTVRGGRFEKCLMQGRGCENDDLKGLPGCF